MATIEMTERKDAIKEFSGLSTDSKPTTGGIPMNSLYLELDTSDLYYWDGTQWAEVGGGA